MANPDRGIRWIDPATKWSFYDEMFYTITGAVPYESEGTFAVVAGIGGIIQYTSGAVAGNRGRLNQSITQSPIDPTKDVLFIMKSNTLQTVQVNHFVGMFSALPTAASPPVQPDDGIYFRRLDAVAVANWFAVCRKAGVETAVDLEVAGDANAHDFNIIVKNAKVQFFIDGKLKTTIETNVPVVALAGGNVWVTREAVAKVNTVDAWATINSRV